MSSLYNLLNAERVEAFLSDLENANGGEPFHERAKLLQCIHMLIWLHSSRPGSTAGAYAFSGLMDALGLKTWSFTEGRIPVSREKLEAEVAAAVDREFPGHEGESREALIRAIRLEWTNPDLAEKYRSAAPSNGKGEGE